jgi:hypothetical protein
MNNSWVSPGQAAHEAFTIGVRVAALAALCAIGVLYWAGAITSPPTIIALILSLPVYFILVAVLLSKWLGLAPDVTDLKPVSPDE